MIKLRLLFIFISLLFTSGVFAQVSSVTISGIIKSQTDKSAIPYVNIVVKGEKDKAFIAGTVSNEGGRFSIENLKPGNYFLEIS